MQIALTTFQMKRIGGISQFIVDLVGDLGRRGHQVTVVALSPGDGWARLVAAGLNGVCLKQQRFESQFHFTRHIARYLKHGGFDAVINNIDIRNGVAQRCLRFLPPPMARLAVLHSTKPAVFELAAVNRHVYDAVVAVSPGMQALAAAHLPGQAVSCIPNGIRRPTGDPAGQRRGWSSPLRLLFVGRLENRAKNVVLLPEIVAECKQRGLAVTLTIVGDGRDRPLLEQAISSSAVGHLIELRGAQPPEAIYPVMQEHHALLLPSNFEGLPLTLLEAQLNGCVPVASALPGSTDSAVKAGVTGLLAPPGDAAAFARQVAVLADPERWRTFSQAAMARAQAEFTVEIMGERYERLLGDLTADRAALAHRRGKPDSLRRLFTWQDFLPPPLQRRLLRLTTVGYKARGGNR